MPLVVAGSERFMMEQVGGSYEMNKAKNYHRRQGTA